MRRAPQDGLGAPDKSREVCMKRRQGVRTGSRYILPEENHVPANRIEGNCGIHRGQKLAAKCPHWIDGTGMKEGIAQ